MSESRYSSSESHGYTNSYSSESRGSSESHYQSSHNYNHKNENTKDTIDELIDKYRSGKINGDELAEKIEEINR